MQSFDMQFVEGIRTRLLGHPMYKELDSADKVRVFMQHHVFAVWDFMSLLKRLQQLLTSTTVPWMPGKEATYARFINEIVLGEESDEDGHGGYVSHFDLYGQAMQQCGADLEPMRRFIGRLEHGMNVEDAVKASDIPESVQKFVTSTMDIAMNGKPHEVAAAFFFGREDIIPDMFTHLLQEMQQQGASTDRLVYYLNRHIELDGDTHGPLAEQLLAYLCAGDPVRIQEARATAERCLEDRIALWNGVWDELRVKVGQA